MNERRNCIPEENTAVELSEQEISFVSSGQSYTFPNEDGPEFDSKFRFRVGDHAEFITGKAIFNLHEFTDGCTIAHRSHNQWNEPCYQCIGIETYPYNEYTWIPQNRFQ